MDGQTIFNLVVGVGLPALGWALRMIFDDVRALGRDLSSHKVEAAKEYATKEDLNTLVDRVARGFETIGEKMDRVLERLERKADR